MTDFIIVLRTTEAVKTFTGNAHLSLGAGLSAAVGTIGRAVEADVRAGDGGYAACYTYSCSKGESFVALLDLLCIYMPTLFSSSHIFCLSPIYQVHHLGFFFNFF